MKCETKSQFNSRAKAEKVLRAIWKSNWLSNRKKPCRSYLCRYCGKWHLTSQALKQMENKKGNYVRHN